MPGILRAQDFQQPDDPIVALAEKRERAIKAAVAAGLGSLTDAFDIDELADLIARRNFTAIDSLIDNQVNDAISRSYTSIADVYREAAEQEFDQTNGLLTFDPLLAMNALIPMRQEFVTDIEDQARQVITEQLLAGLRNGADPEDTAWLLQDVIGLTPRQAQAVSNFRRLLEGGDRSALSRALRDQRFDSTIEAWASGLAEPDADKIDAMVERYAERMLAYRAETIARTESLQAAVSGVRGAYLQAVESGKLLASEVKRFWQVCIDERLCPICASIPLMNPTGVGIMTPYLSISGPVFAPLVHTRCRCDELYVADLTRLTETPFAIAA